MVDEGATAIVNVASEEYAKAVTPYAEARGIPVIACVFVAPREKDGRLVQRSTEAKAARGTFVRWCAENDIEDACELTSFSERGYGYEATLSTSDLLTFVRGRT